MPAAAVLCWRLDHAGIDRAIGIGILAALPSHNLADNREAAQTVDPPERDRLYLGVI
jgi:hypothetical protein